MFSILDCCPCRKFKSNPHEQLNDSHVILPSNGIANDSKSAAANHRSDQGIDNPALQMDESPPPVFNHEIIPKSFFDFKSLLDEGNDWEPPPELPFLTRAQVSNATDPTVLESEVFKYDRSDLVYLSEIGNAWFGKVIRAEAVGIVPGVRKSLVLVCQLKDTASLADTAAFLSHAQPFRELDHPNILPLLGQCIEQIPRLLIYEHCTKGCLKAVLKELYKDESSRKSESSGKLLLQFASQLSSAIGFMHTYKLLYPDLAAHSCVVDYDNSLKLGDYGLSHEIFPEDYIRCSGVLIPLRWIEPGSLDLSKCGMGALECSKSANVWSLCCTIWEIIMFGEQPYSNLSDEQLRETLESHNVQNLPSIVPRWHFIHRVNELLSQGWQKSHLRPNARHFADSLNSMLKSYDTDSVSFSATTQQLDEPDLDQSEATTGAGGDCSVASSYDVTKDDFDVNLAKYDLQDLSVLQTTFIPDATSPEPATDDDVSSNSEFPSPQNKSTDK